MRKHISRQRPIELERSYGAAKEKQINALAILLGAAEASPKHRGDVSAAAELERKGEQTQSLITVQQGKMSRNTR